AHKENAFIEPPGEEIMTYIPSTIDPFGRDRIRATLISWVSASVIRAKTGKYPSWSRRRCNLTGLLVWWQVAQSKRDRQSSMSVASRLKSLFLKRNFLFPGAIFWTLPRSW
ncbi:MAG: hypothetical protein WDK95_14210, partial [Syntrophorhabdaceae bacterium]